MYSLTMGFPGGSVGKASTCNAGDAGRCELDLQVRKIPWMRAWQPTLVFLPGDSHLQRSLASYSPWDCKGSDMTEATEYACMHSLRIGIFSYIAIGNLSIKINLTLIEYFYIICHPYSNLLIGSLISFVAFIFSPKRGSNISFSSCTCLGCFNLKYFHSLPLSLVCHFWRIDFSPHFCVHVISRFLARILHHSDVVFSGYYLISICSSLLMLILITWWRWYSLSPLYDRIFSACNYRQQMRTHFKTYG